MESMARGTLAGVPAGSGRPIGLKVLVTGGTGFVGNALCAHLAGRGVLVRTAVRSTPGGERSDAVVVGDIGADTDWSTALEGVDPVVHLAARVHIDRDASRDPLAEYRRVNVEGTRRLASMAAGRGVRRFVFLSSAKVNGEVTHRPYTEADPPRPEDAYAVSKWEAEQALMQLGARDGHGVGHSASASGLRARGACQFPQADARGGCGHPASVRVDRQPAQPALSGQSRRCDPNLPRAPACWRQNISGQRRGRSVDARAGAPPRASSERAFPPAANAGCAAVSGGSDDRQAAAVDRLVGSLQLDTSAIRETLGWTPPFGVDQGLQETARWFRRAVAAPA